MAAINDLVLVHVDNKPGFYARIEDISPDVKRGWWEVKLLVLSFPMQEYTWILDDSQVAGAPFTMGGTPLQLEKIAAPVGVKSGGVAVDDQVETGGEGREPSRPKVVSLVDRKKNK